MSQTNLFGAIVAPSRGKAKKSGTRKALKPQEPMKSQTSELREKEHKRNGSHQRLLKRTAPFPVLWDTAMKTMRETFGIESLRNLQPTAIKCALKQQHQIIVMATGGGKSLCYQLPALCLPGVTLVISPLIALMVDQVQALLEKGVSAALVSSASGQRNNAIVMERLLGRRFGKSNDKSALKPITLLYCTPELIQTDRFRGTLRELYQKQGLAMFAIDEAHCVSTWGHDFRAAYRKLSWLRQEFPTVPIMACTATATKKVLRDMKNKVVEGKLD